MPRPIYRAEYRVIGYNPAGCSMYSSSLITEPLGAAAEPASLYRRDPYAWANRQAEALRRRELEAADWDNVIEEIESVGRAEKRPWVTNCAKAIERMLLVEHWSAPSASDLEGWEDEILAFRRLMASTIDDNPSLHGESAAMLSQAWKIGRRDAVDRMVAHSSDGAVDDGFFRRVFEANLPKQCPYLAEHVAAYDPKVDKGPRDDVWPPGVATVFNRVFGEDFAILRDPGREQGWSR